MKWRISTNTTIMPTTKMRPDSGLSLLLFDIDGTLILGGGAGEGALFAAMEKGFGRTAGFDSINMAGATDQKIARELLVANDLAVTEENMATVIENYLEALHHLMPAKGGVLLPGIVELLDVLHAREDCVLGLLTGNVRRGAEIKLSHFGVWHYFPFGAFADDHHDRNELGPFARQRALEYHGESFPAEKIFVLGDTPRDIECSRAFGANAVAIGTGKYSLQELAAHQPDFLFADLSDTQAVVQALLGPAATPHK
jgi:phosphoglycolate phosphatase